MFHALEALHLGDLLRISVRPTRALLPPLFTGRRARANRACALPFGRAHRTASQPDSAVCAALGANRKLASPLPPASQGSHCCQRGTRRRRDLSRLPFRGDTRAVCSTQLRFRLGSAHPGPTAVRLEPCSTSVFTAATRIFATTTKICTRGCFTAPCGSAAPQPPRPPTRRAAARRHGIGGALSAIHFQGWFIRQVSHDTLLSGCRHSWPPPCCLDEPTPFVVSVCAHSGTLPVLPVHPASPVLLTKNGPLGASIRTAGHASTGRLADSKFENRLRLLQPRGL